MAVTCDKCPLRASGAFVPFTADEAKFMQRFKVGELTVAPGTRFLTEKTTSPQVYTALTGLGLRTKSMPKGRRQVVNFVFPGDFLGLQAGIMGEMGHSVIATTDMTLCVFDRAELWTLFRSQPDRAFDMTWIAASEEMFLGEALATLGQRTALQAVAWALFRLYRRGAVLGLTRGTRMPLPFRQQDLADALGLSLVHTNKTLAKLKARNLAVWQDGLLTLPDRDALAEIAGVETDDMRPRPLI